MLAMPMQPHTWAMGPKRTEREKGLFQESHPLFRHGEKPPTRLKETTNKKKLTYKYIILHLYFLIYCTWIRSWYGFLAVFKVGDFPKRPACPRLPQKSCLQNKAKEALKAKKAKEALKAKKAKEALKA